MDWAKILTHREGVSIERGALWRPSELGYCLRRQYMSALGVPMRPIDDKLAGIFALGSMVHAYVRRRLEEEGVLVAAELPVRIQRLAGHVDFLAREGDQVVGIELKTLNANAFQLRQRRPEERLQEHQAVQAGAYRYLLRSTEYGDVPFRIVVVSKDDLAAYEVEVPDSYTDLAMERHLLLEELWDRRELPSCTCTGWERRYCAYAEEGGSCCDMSKAMEAMEARFGGS